MALFPADLRPDLSITVKLQCFALMRLCSSYKRKTERSDAVPFWRLSVASLSICLTSVGYTQNLIPNPSFEDFDTCLTGLFQVYRATGWNSYMRTPDYFNACADTAGSGEFWDVPSNLLTYQAAYDGQAYMGMFTYEAQAGPDEEYREHIGATLLEPLVIGTTYYASFRTNLAMVPDPLTSHKHGSSHFGMLCTNVSSVLPDSYDEVFWPRNFAHVYMPSVLTDTLNWTLVSGSFVADSAYTHVVIGNLFDNEHSDTIAVMPGSSVGSYHLVDEVCLSTDPNFCPLYNGVNGVSISNGLWVWYPIGAEVLHIHLRKSEVATIEVFDPMGRKVYSQAVNGQDQVELSTTQLAAGSYFLFAIGAEGVEALKFAVMR